MSDKTTGKLKETYNYISYLVNDCNGNADGIKLLELGVKLAEANGNSDYLQFFEAELLYFRDREYDKYEEMLLGIETCDDYILWRIGEYFRLNHQEDTAIGYYDNALIKDPNNYNALFCKGDFFQDMERHGNALECYDRILKNKPESVSALNAKAKLLNMLDDKEGALECFDKVLAIESGNECARQEKENITYDPVAIIRRLDEQLEGNPDNYDLLKQKAEVLYYDIDEEEEALKICGILLKVKPDDVDVLEMMGETLCVDGQIAAAGVIFDTIPEGDPDNFYALNVKFLSCQFFNIEKDREMMLDVARQIVLKCSDGWDEEAFRCYYEDTCGMSWEEIMK